MRLTIAKEFCTVGPVVIGLLSLDKSGQQLGFSFLSAEKIKDWIKVRKFDVELYEAGDVGFLFFCINPSPISFEVKEYWQP